MTYIPTESEKWVWGFTDSNIWKQPDLLLESMQHQLAKESGRAMAGSWSYDPGRHASMISSYKRVVVALKGEVA